MLTRYGHVLWTLDSVAEVGPNYTLLRGEETKAMRRKGDVDMWC